MLRGKRGKSFLVQFARPNDSVGTIEFCRTFVELFWSVRVDLKQDARGPAGYFPPQII